MDRMKRLSAYLTILGLLCGVQFLNASSLKPFAFLFSGRWQQSEDALLIDENGFQLFINGKSLLELLQFAGKNLNLVLLLGQTN